MATTFPPPPDLGQEEDGYFVMRRFHGYVSLPYGGDGWLWKEKNKRPQRSRESTPSKAPLLFAANPNLEALVRHFNEEPLAIGTWRDARFNPTAAPRMDIMVNEEGGRASTCLPGRPDPVPPKAAWVLATIYHTSLR